jgi:hypothetical protein
MQLQGYKPPNEAIKYWLKEIDDEKARNLERLRDLVMTSLKAQAWPAALQAGQDEKTKAALKEIVEQTINIVLKDLEPEVQGYDDVELEMAAMKALRDRFDGNKFKAIHGTGQFSSQAITSASRSVEPDDCLKEFGLYFHLFESLITYADTDQLPQNEPQWLALRRLFLALCEQSIPKGFELDPLGIGGDSDLNHLTSESIWREFVPLLPRIKRIVEKRLRWYEDLTLDKVGQMLVDETEFELGIQSGELADIVRAFCHLVRYSSPDEDSIQHYLMSHFRRIGRDSIKEEYREARKLARRVLFDSLTSTSKVANVNRTLAQYWVYAHCPLWLMSNTAITKVGKNLLVGGWTNDTLRRQIPKSGLYRPKLHPIADVVRKGPQILGFVVAKGVCSSLPMNLVIECYDAHLFPNCTRPRKTGAQCRQQYSVWPKDTSLAIRNSSRA